MHEWENETDLNLNRIIKWIEMNPPKTHYLRPIWNGILQNAHATYFKLRYLTWIGYAGNIVKQPIEIWSIEKFDRLICAHWLDLWMNALHASELSGFWLDFKFITFPEIKCQRNRNALISVKSILFVASSFASVLFLFHSLHNNLYRPCLVCTLRVNYVFRTCLNYILNTNITI